MKNLIKKFSFRELEKEALKQGWIIPTADEVRDCDIAYDEVWVSNRPLYKEDVETHAMLYYKKTDSLGLCNKSFIQNAVVKKQKCEWNKGEYPLLMVGACGGSLDMQIDDKFDEDYDWKYCPYCGKEIQR